MTFAIIPSAVISNTRLSPVTKAVYASLAVRCDQESGRAFPHRSTIAREHGITETTVSRATRTLEAEGLIVKSRNEGGRNQSAIYYLIPDPDQHRHPLPAKPYHQEQGFDINPITGDTRKEQTIFFQNEPPPTPSPVGNPVEEGAFVFQNQEPVCVAVRPWEINPEPIPLYEVTEQEVDVESITLDTLPAGILALDRPDPVAQLNPIILLPIMVALLGVAPDLAQTLIDELAGRMSCQTLKPIDSPLSYFRFLLKEAKAGRFVPKYGLDVAAGRAAEARHKATMARSIAGAATMPPDSMEKPERPAEKMSPEKFRAMLQGRQV